MKIEQTKLWDEFKEWLFTYGFSGRTFRDMYFEGKEGYYRAFLRESQQIVINLHYESAITKIKWYAVSSAWNKSSIETKSFDTYEQAFMELIKEIFNQPK